MREAKENHRGRGRRCAYSTSDAFVLLQLLWPAMSMPLLHRIYP